MKLFDFFTSKPKQVINISNKINVIYPTSNHVYNSDENVMHRFQQYYENCAPMNAVINKAAAMLSKPIFRVKNTITGEFVEDTGIYSNLKTDISSFYKLMKNPNYLQTFKKLKQLSDIRKDIFGDRYLNFMGIDGWQGQPTALWDLPSPYVRVVLKYPLTTPDIDYRTNEIVGYYYYQDIKNTNNWKANIPATNIFHESALNTDCYYDIGLATGAGVIYGKTRFLSVENYIKANIANIKSEETLTQTSTAHTAVMPKGINIGGENFQSSSVDDVEANQKAFKKYGLQEGQSPFVIFDHPMDIVSVPNPLSSINFDPKRTAQANVIYNARGLNMLIMHPELVKNRTDANGLEKFIWQQTLIPETDEWCQGITQYLLQPFWGSQYEYVADYSGIEAMQKDKKVEATTIEMYFRNGFISRGNAIRMLMDIDNMIEKPTPEQEKEFYISNQVQKLNEDGTIFIPESINITKPTTPTI